MAVNFWNANGVPLARPSAPAWDARQAGQSLRDLGRETPVEAIGSASIPQTFIPTYSVDDAGVSYPAGTKFVQMGSGSVIAVPDSLPGGYTGNDDHGIDKGGSGLTRQISVMSRASYFMRDGVYIPQFTGFCDYRCTPNAGSIISDFLPPTYFSVNSHYAGITSDPDTSHQYYWSRLHSGGAIYDPTWGPVNNGTSVITIGRGNPYESQIFIGATSFAIIRQSWIYPHPGYRNVRCFAQMSTAFTAYGTIRFTFTRNADWSMGTNNTVPGGTAVTSVTLTPDTAGGGNSKTTDIALSPPDGTVGAYHLRIEAKYDGAFHNYNLNAFAYFSPRVDIPLPFTVTGDNEIATGGYLTGHLADPELRPPVLLTNVYQIVSAFVNGDDSNIYGYADLPAGSYDLETSSSFIEALYSDDEFLATSTVSLFSNILSFSHAGGRAYFLVNNPTPLDLKVS